MIRGRKKGFTIVEVVFFLAISGMLIVGVMLSVGSRQNSVEFTDSMRSLQAFLESQRGAAEFGVNDNLGYCDPSTPSTGGDTLDCVHLGRVVLFEVDASEASYYTMVGDRIALEDVDGCSNSLLYCSRPSITLSSSTPNDYRERKFNILWQVKFTGGRHTLDTGAETNSRALAFLSSPRSATVSSATYSATNNMLARITNRNTYSDSSSTFTTGSNVDAHYCFISSDDSKKAVITLVDNQVDLIFDPDSTYSC